MKFQVFGKPGLTNKPLQGGLAHLGYIFKLHVICDKSFYLLGFLIGKSQATANCLGHANAHFHVSIKTNPVAGLGGRAEGGRLSDVMKKNAPSETRRGAGWQPVEHHAGVNPDVTFGMIFGGLVHTFHVCDFRQ